MPTADDDRSALDLAQMRERIAGLPANEPLLALVQIGTWLESVNRTDPLGLPERLGLISTLDHAAKIPHQQLAHHYLAVHSPGRPDANAIWNACFGFAKALGSAYIHCIENLRAARPGAAALEAELPVIAGRALRALTVQIKWILQRYELIDERIWGEIGEVYSFAETRGVAAARAALYPGRHGESSAQEEFLKAMMLAVSGPDGLLADKLHLAERIVAHFGRAFVVRAEPAIGCPFYFDLTAHRPPARAYRSMARGPMTRFFGPGAAAQALRSFMQEIAEKRAIPDDVNLGGAFENETVLAVLAHLEEHWSAVPPARGAPRRPLATRISVIPGFPRTLDWLHALQRGGAGESAHPAGAESWIVYDMSEGGFGAIVPNARTEWLQVGAVVGLRSEASSAWRVGVIRRIAQDDFGQRRVGIEVLGRFAFPVRVSWTSTGAAGAPSASEEDAILLSKQPDEKGEIALLLRAGGFVPAQRVQLQVRDKEYFATPAALVESGREFDWAHLKVAKP